LAGAATGLALLALAGVTAWKAWSLASCEPTSWADWHVAIQRACVTPQYVCEHMTTASLLADPGLLAEHRRALSTGQREALVYLEALVGHLREAYGCEGPRPGARPGADPRLPPGHPPIPSGAPIFQPPATLEI
jgi:hypothetical protein